MSNVSITARHNESKHQMVVEVLPALTPPPDGIVNTRMAVGAKETTTVASGHINQVSFMAFLTRAIQKLVDENYLNRAQAGEFPDGIIIYGQLNYALAPDVTIAALDPTRNYYATIADGDAFLMLPSAAGWVADGATNELTNIGTRLIEKLREEFLVTV